MFSTKFIFNYDSKKILLFKNSNHRFSCLKDQFKFKFMIILIHELYLISLNSNFLSLIIHFLLVVFCKSLFMFIDSLDHIES
jgi:hypothetical protein